MSITISMDVFCNYCGNWVHGTTGYKLGARRARRNAKREGWVRRLSPATGKMIDVCPVCAATPLAILGALNPPREPEHGGVDLHPGAVALRPVRAFKTRDGFRFYEATTFPQWLWGGCETYLRRCKAMGFLKDDGCLIVLDVLDENGDVIQDFPLTIRGFHYLRREFGFKVVKDA